MNVEITNQSFYMKSNNVEPTLNELKELYPTIELNYESPSTNLQLLLYNLGFHSRILINDDMFTISRLPKGSIIEDENPVQTLTIVSNYMTMDSYIIATIDNKIIEFRKDNIKIEASDVSSSISETVDNISIDIDIIDEKEELPIDKPIGIKETDELKPEKVINTTTKRGRNKK